MHSTPAEKRIIEILKGSLAGKDISVVSPGWALGDSSLFLLCCGLLAQHLSSPLVKTSRSLQQYCANKSIKDCGSEWYHNGIVVKILKNPEMGLE